MYSQNSSNQTHQAPGKEAKQESVTSIKDLFPQNVIKLLRGAERALVCVDPTDTDNLELPIAAANHFGIDNICIVLTGRCAIHPDQVAERVAKAAAEGIPAHEAIPLSEWDRDYSQLLLEASALRFKKVLQRFGHHDACLIVDGGLAKAPKVPHGVHMDDLFGFGDISKDEFQAIQHGALAILADRAKVKDFVGNSNFVAFVGGPATGLNLLLEENPDIGDRWVGWFGQFGSLGSVKGMEIPGRVEGAQFNVMLDPPAGKALIKKTVDLGVPGVFLPTDVTRKAEIGFGDSTMLDFLCKSDSPGMLYLANLRTIWEENAIRPRPGEVLLTHDLATLFLFKQLIDETGNIYSGAPLKSANVITKGAREGVIDFEIGAGPSNLVVATELTNPRAYLEELRISLTEPQLQRIQKVFLATSLSAEDQADPIKMQEYERRIAIKVGPLLREGAQVHFGCHPAALRLMNDYARRYPSQVVAHLLTKFKETRDLLPNIPDADVHWHDSSQENYFDKMIVEMVRDCDAGIFVGGRRDVKSTESGESDMLYEFSALLWANPDALLLVDNEFDGIASDLDLARQVTFLAKMVGTERFGRILTLLSEYPANDDQIEPPNSSPL